MNDFNFKKTMASKHRSLLLGALLLGGLGVAGCGDDDASVASSPGGSAGAAPQGRGGEPSLGGADSSEPAAGAGVGGVPATEDPVVAVLTRLTRPDGRNFYLHLLRELPSGGELDYTKAFEFGEAFASVNDGFVYVSDREAMSVTKYAVTPNLRLDELGTLSFMGLGVSFVGIGWLARGVPVIADSESGQVVRWDPEEMALGASADIPESVLMRGGIAGGAWGWNPVTAGGRSYFGWSWIDYDTGEVAPVVALASLPVEGAPLFDEPITDDRCAVNDGFPFADGDENIYVVGQGSWDPAATPTDPACVLRLPSGQDAFDPDYNLDLLDAVGALDIYTTWPMAGGSKLLVNYWPEDEPAPADADGYWEANVFRLAVVDLTSGESVTVDDVPAGGAMSYFSLELDGERYVQVYDFTGEVSNSQLYRIHADGSADPVVRAGSNADFQMMGRVR